MTSALAALDPSNRILKRAQYEAFSFQLADGDVLVRNGSPPDPANHEYLVDIEAGVPTNCDCPADDTAERPCKHRVAVAIRDPVLAAAITAQTAAPVAQPGQS